MNAERRMQQREERRASTADACAEGSGPFDVAIVGGGPAGSALGLRLGRIGCSVVLLERTHYDDVRVGESLAPAVEPLLQRLGIRHPYAVIRSVPFSTVGSAWSSDELVDLDVGVTPGRHVDRAAFDAMLADAARDAGCTVRDDWSAVRFSFDHGEWRITASDGRSVRAALLVDATGRRAGVGHALGSRREVFDRQVAISARWHRIAPESDPGVLLIEPVAEGWWYTAPLPGGGLVGMLFTDVDLCRRDRLVDSPVWRTALARAARSNARSGGSHPAQPPQVHPTAAGRLMRGTDDRPWFAVGDATLSVDPLSGSGVRRALEMADRAVPTALAVLDNPDETEAAVAAYEAESDRECTRQLEERLRVYGECDRFASEYWSRRRSAGRGLAVGK